LSTNLKNILVWLAVVVSLVLLWQLFYSVRDANIEEKDWTTFYREMTDKKIKSVKIMGEDLEGEEVSGKKFKTVIPADSGYDLAKELQQNGVSVKLEKSSNSSLMYVFLSSWLPFILLIGFWIFLMRQMQSGGNKALSFGKSRARLLSSQ
jgi:cell division protease FtsH